MYRITMDYLNGVRDNPSLKIGSYDETTHTININQISYTHCRYDDIVYYTDRLTSHYGNFGVWIGVGIYVRHKKRLHCDQCMTVFYALAFLDFGGLN